MKRLPTLVILSAAISLSTLATLTTEARAAGDKLRNLKRGEVVPSFVLQKTGGKEIDSTIYAGQVLVVVYLSAEQRSSELMATEVSHVVTDLGISEVSLLFATADAVYAPYFQRFFEEMHLTAPLGYDLDRDLYGKLGLIVLPTTIVVDREGKLTHVISGHQADSRYVLEQYVLHTLGLIADEQLEERLTAPTFRRGTPRNRAGRHRVAARLLREKGLLASAEKELHIALEIDPENLEVRLDLASLYLVETRVDEAAEIVDAILAENEDQRRAKLLNGIILYRRGSLEEARDLLEEALILNPDPARTHYYLGLVYEALDKPTKAMYHYRESLVRLLDEPEPMPLKKMIGGQKPNRP